MQLSTNSPAMAARWTRLVALWLAGCALAACQGGGSNVPGNENGSEPINAAESNEYKKAVVRCYKMGGTRVVKIMDQLRCY
jgi:hypothetical protein